MGQIGQEWPAIRVKKPEVAPPFTMPEKTPEVVTVPERELVPAR